MLMPFFVISQLEHQICYEIDKGENIDNKDWHEDYMSQ